MRIGFDCDGVLADFNASFIDILKRITGKDRFGPGFVPTTWDYPQAVGYSADDVSKVWDAIIQNPTFWLSLRPYWDAMTILERLRIASYEHDVYFITARPGIKAKQQTEVWLATHSGDFTWNPTVLISGVKGAVAGALKLDAYIDDRVENCLDAGQVCLTFIIDRPWNHDFVAPVGARVDSAAEMLDVLDIRYDQKAVA